MRPFAMMYVLLIMSTTVSEYSTSAFRAAEDRIRGEMPALAQREQEFVSDAQGLLGLASLCERYATSPEFHKRSGELHRKVVATEPENRAAWAALAQYGVTDFIGRRRRLLMQFDMKRQYASREKLQEVEILDWNAELYDWLREENQDRVVVRDFDEARVRLVQKLERDLPTVLDVLTEGKANDPNNALYDYLHAALEFELGHDEDAMAMTERGAEKPRLESYKQEMLAAREKVLQAIGFSEEDRNALEEHAVRSEVSVNVERVFQMAKQYETAENLQRAKRTYETLLGVARHLRRDRIPGHPDGGSANTVMSERIEREAKRALDGIRADADGSRMR